MKLETTKLDINRNKHLQWQIGNPNPIQNDGYLEITGEAKLTDGDLIEVHNTMDNSKSIELYGKSKDDWYILKDCLITGFNYTTDANGKIEASVDFKAGAYEPAYKDITFKDGKVKVSYKDYLSVKDDIDNFEDITYEEFLDRVMVEEL